MKKILISTGVLTLTLAAYVPRSFANPTAANNFPHIVSLSEFPQGIRHWRILRHTFKLEIPKKSPPISQLIIEAPSNIVVRESLDISDQRGKKINANISIKGKKVTLAFTVPVASETMLTIEMNKVKKTAPTIGEKLYKISAILVGINAELPIGVARLRVNG